MVKNEKHKFQTMLTLLAVGVVTLGMLVSACQPKVSTQEIRAVLQAIDGQELVLTLDDGTKIRVQAEKQIDDAKKMIGEEVEVEIEAGDDNPKLVRIVRVPVQAVGTIPGLQVSPEDFHFIGVIESMGVDAWVVDGRSFKVNSATILDTGLAVGVLAEVEFIKLADGSMLATEIETPPDEVIAAALGQPGMEIGEDFSLTGTIGSISASELVLGGKTFKIDANTILDEGLVPGVLARVEFVIQADGSLLALGVETDAPDSVLPGTLLRAQENFTAEGPIRSISSTSVMVDDRKFTIDANTILDNGLAPDVLVRVEFVIKPDGTLLAKEVETSGIDEGENLYFAGPIESIGAAAWVIGGKTFVITPATLLDDGLSVGVNANVEFIIRPDGSFEAVHIEDSGFEFIGVVQVIAPDAFTISGRIFKTDANTLIDRGLKVGKLAEVNFLIQADGSLLALKIKKPKVKIEGFTFKGVVQSLSASSIMVTGQTFQIEPTTVIGTSVAVGAEVNVVFDIKAGGILSAMSVQNVKAVQKK